MVFPNSIPATLGESLLYSSKAYIQSHNDPTIVSFNNYDFIIHLSISDNEAYGFKYAPFVAASKQKEANLSGFKNFEQNMVQSLLSKGIHKITLRQPPFYYPDSIPNDWLEQTGYSMVYRDHNQYIELKDYATDQIHPMQQRKLRKSIDEGLLFTREPAETLKEIHNFISNCRKAVGLTVNIGKEKLVHLFNNFPGHYSAFSIRNLQNELMSAVIMVQPLKDISYYYLPATYPQYKSQSPMVFLLHHVIEYYQSRDIKIMDLGISSLQGKMQEGLFNFKERMGAKATTSLVFTKLIG